MVASMTWMRVIISRHLFCARCNLPMKPETWCRRKAHPRRQRIQWVCQFCLPDEFEAWRAARVEEALRE